MVTYSYSWPGQVRYLTYFSIIAPTFSSYSPSFSFTRSSVALPTRVPMNSGITTPGRAFEMRSFISRLSISPALVPMRFISAETTGLSPIRSSRAFASSWRLSWPASMPTMALSMVVKNTSRTLSMVSWPTSRCTSSFSEGLSSFSSWLTKGYLPYFLSSFLTTRSTTSSSRLGVSWVQFAVARMSRATTRMTFFTAGSISSPSSSVRTSL